MSWTTSQAIGYLLFFLFLFFLLLLLLFLWFLFLWLLLLLLWWRGWFLLFCAFAGASGRSFLSRLFWFFWLSVRLLLFFILGFFPFHSISIAVFLAVRSLRSLRPPGPVALHHPHCSINLATKWLGNSPCASRSLKQIPTFGQRAWWWQWWPWDAWQHIPMACLNPQRTPEPKAFHRVEAGSHASTWTPRSCMDLEQHVPET